MTVLEALKGVLKLALIHDGLARGLREASKALDRRQAHMCVLNEGCEEEAYKKLVVALCAEHSIPLIKVPDGKQLGEWAGLCRWSFSFLLGVDGDGDGQVDVVDIGLCALNSRQNFDVLQTCRAGRPFIVIPHPPSMHYTPFSLHPFSMLPLSISCHISQIKITHLSSTPPKLRRSNPPSFFPMQIRTKFKTTRPANLSIPFQTGVLDREGNARKIVNCSCVVVRDWGEESQERSILINYFQTGE